MLKNSKEQNISGKIWKNFGKFQKKLENFGKNLKNSEKIGKFWKKSENFGRNQTFLWKKGLLVS